MTPLVLSHYHAGAHCTIARTGLSTNAGKTAGSRVQAAGFAAVCLGNAADGQVGFIESGGKIMEVQGKVAIVTGGGSGIGRQVALMLARHGATVSVGDIEADRASGVADEIRRSGGKALGIEVDVTKAAQVEELVRETLALFDTIDILVNSAGIYPQSSAVEMKEEEWDRVIAVNLKGTFLACREALRHMIEKRHGRIVNISAGHGFRGVRNGAHYAASKAGVNALTKSLALEAAPYSVLVNAVAPGPVDTPLPRGGRLYSEEEKKQIGLQLPMGRMGTTEDIASTVLFLASDACRWFTGQIIYHNGGDIMPG
ncbi:MAG: SDR family oxidoreductase [Acidobacteria bacterium]|nr:SDR family oxidoreductase [Acidobacteriota bacterium]